MPSMQPARTSIVAGRLVRFMASVAPASQHTVNHNCHASHHGPYQPTDNKIDSEKTKNDRKCRNRGNGSRKHKEAGQSELKRSVHGKPNQSMNPTQTQN